MKQQKISLCKITLGKDGNASMPEQVKRPNPWKKMMMMMNFILNYQAFPR
jgi:hypothetical protein